MLNLSYAIKRWPMIEPFIIAGQQHDYVDAVIVTLTDKYGYQGRGEACGVDYHGETCELICHQLECVRNHVEHGVSREELQLLLPAGGARNGLDCALWDLHCQSRNTSIWFETGIPQVKTIETVYTIGIVTLEHAAELANKYKSYNALKIKSDHTGSIETIRKVRQICPDAKLIIDANQSWTPALFTQLEAELKALNIALLEQPFAVGQDDFLLSYRGDLILAADESVQTSSDLLGLQHKYQVINIKLDKTGGLTEALNLAHNALKMGFRLMVGNMCGSSLAMAPGLVIAQHCDYVDLDGPLLQSEDVTPCLHYKNGQIFIDKTAHLWGNI